MNDVRKYLDEYVKGKQVFLKFEPSAKPENDVISAYVYLKNKIFINKEIVKNNFADVANQEFKYRDNFLKAINSG